MRNQKKKRNIIVQSFIEGILIIMPFALTGFVIFYCLKKMHQFVMLFSSYIPGIHFIRQVPGLSSLVVLALLVLLGLFASNLIVKTAFRLLEKVTLRIPGVNILYAYIKDYTNALVDRLDRPVLVLTNSVLQIKRVGFITQESMKNLDLGEEVAVYLPHSFSFSGELQIMPSKYIQKIQAPRTAVLKFVLSGGLSNMERPLKKI